MGLLDQFAGLGNLDESQTHGLLAAASKMLEMSGPSNTPRGFGQIAGGGIQAFAGGVNEAKRRQQEEQQAKQMEQMRGLQIQGLEGDMAIKQQQRERMERIRTALTPGAQPASHQPATGSPLNGAPYSHGEAQAAFSAAGQDGMTGYDPDRLNQLMASARQGGGALLTPPANPGQGQGQAAPSNATKTMVERLTATAQVYAAEGDIEGANKLYEQAAKFQPKVKSWQQVRKDGKVLYAPYFEDGTAGEPVPMEVAEKLNFQDTGGKTVGLNPFSGQVESSYNNTQSPNNKATVGAAYAQANATREIANATRNAAEIRRDQETEMKLGDDYRTQSKSFKEVGEAYRTINATLDKATMSPAATLAGATKFMKLLDPGSVVRESELGMAMAASGVFDRATNYHNTLLRGKVLTPTQVADFKKITNQIYTAAQQGQQEIDKSYRTQAETYGLRPNMVVQDLGQNKSASMVEKPKANASNKGRTLIEHESGKRFRSNGIQWIEVK